MNTRRQRPVPEVMMQGWVIETSFVKVECFNITGTSEPGVDIRALRSAIEIAATYIHDIPAPAVNMARADPSRMPANVTIHDNYITRTAYGFNVFCRDNCVLADNEVQRTTPGITGHDGDYSRLFGEGIVFLRNYFHGNSISDCEGCHIDCFQTWNLGRSSYEIARRITLDGNICFNAHEGIIARDVSGQAVQSHLGWTVTNNVFRYGPTGSRMAWCALFEHVGDVTFHHNLCGEGVVGYRNDGSSSHLNNIHYNTGWKPYFAETGAEMTSRANLLFNPTRKYAGFGGDLLNVDPNFVDSNGDDYRLQSNSPAIGRGAPTTVDRDRLGYPRSKPGDIGPHEFGARPLPPGRLTLHVEVSSGKGANE
ncbi:MAG: hypothetical protein R2729_23480 [Bryobacteraceae bacterium]